MRIAELLKKWRLMSELSLRDAGAMIGISAATLMWLERGKVPDGTTLLVLQNWLFALVAKEESDGSRIQSTGKSDE